MTKVISYFSYKGGAGRSTLAYNTIPVLAAEHLHPTKDNPIVIVDMDIDSCGMSYLLEVNNITDDNCIQNILNNGCGGDVAESISEHETLGKLIPVGDKFGYHDKNAILFLPAKDGKTVSEEGKSNYSDADNPWRPKLESFVETCKKYNVSAIILDSAVGNQGPAVVSNQVADIIVCCMRPTIQFVNGTVRYLESLDSDSAKFSSKEIIIVPNVVPQDELVIDGYRYPDVAIDRIHNKLIPLLGDDDDFAENEYDIGMLEGDVFGIPALKSFMWREGQLYTKDNLSEEEQVVLGRYKTLAGLIYNHFE